MATGKPENRNGNRKKRTLPKACEAYKFKPGQSGNPGGRPRRDVAADLARAIFEKNEAVIYAAMMRAIKKGDAKVFSVLADRAYGKLTTKVEGEMRGSVVLITSVQRPKR